MITNSIIRSCHTHFPSCMHYQCRFERSLVARSTERLWFRWQEVPLLAERSGHGLVQRASEYLVKKRRKIKWLTIKALFLPIYFTILDLQNWYYVRLTKFLITKHLLSFLSFSLFSSYHTNFLFIYLNLSYKFTRKSLFIFYIPIFNIVFLKEKHTFRFANGWRGSVWNAILHNF